MFCFDLLVFGLKRNVLLCLRQFSDQIKLLCFVPEFSGQNENDLLAIQFFMYQINMFCFRSDSKETESKRFAFDPIISFDIETFVLSFRYRWHYYPGGPKTWDPQHWNIHWPTSFPLPGQDLVSCSGLRHLPLREASKLIFILRGKSFKKLQVFHLYDAYRQ